MVWHQFAKAIGSKANGLASNSQNRCNERKIQKMAQEVNKEAPEAEKQTNCPACNKLIKKIKKYYRNGKNYCTKKCWLKASRKPAEETAK